MANLTITVDDEVLKRARIRALEQGTSVNALLADALRRYALLEKVQEEVWGAVLDHAGHPTADDLARARARGGRSWRRADLYDR